MTREETAKILTVISAIYPNFRPIDKTATVSAWNMVLEDYSYEEMSIALKTFVKTSGKGFPPSADQLIAMTKKPAELLEMSEGEAWDLVNKALRNSAYNSEKEFEKLPVAVQKAVGSASQLHAWAIDQDYNESVISSNFMRCYRVTAERQRQIASLPAEARLKLEALQNQALRIGEK